MNDLNGHVIGRAAPDSSPRTPGVLLMCGEF
jgi:hypothetical protein